MRAAAIISLLSGSTALAQQSDIVDESSQVFILVSGRMRNENPPPVACCIHIPGECSQFLFI